MRKFLNSKYGQAIILTALSVLNIIFTVIYYSAPWDATSGRYTLWTAKAFDTAAYHIVGLNTYYVLAFVVGVALFAASAALVFVKRKKVLFYASAIYNFILDIAVFLTGVILKILSTAVIVFAMLSMLVSIATIVFLFFTRNLEKKNIEPQTEEQQGLTQISAKTSLVCKIAMLACESVATVLMFVMLFLPLYSVKNDSARFSYRLINTLTAPSYPIYLYIIFLVMFLACFLGLLKFVTTLSFYKSNKVFAQKSRSYMYGATVYGLVFFILGYGLSFYYNLANKTAENAAYAATTTAYIPFIISVAILIVFSVFYGKSGVGENIADKQVSPIKLKIEPLFYVIVLTAISFAMLLINIISVECVVSGNVLTTVSLSGHKLLTAYADLEAGYQVLSFVLTAMLIASGTMLVLCVVSLVSKSKDYYKVIKTSAISNLVFVALMGLFGIYFKIAQKINEENLMSLLEYFHIGVMPDYEYNVKSSAFYLLIASLLVIILMIVRKQFNLTEKEPISVKLESGLPQQNTAEKPAEKEEIARQLPKDEPREIEKPADFDACPAFTELDGKEPQFIAEANEKRRSLFTNLTLPNLVRFVVDYARECRLHLSYSAEDIATFVAGLGASRLTILQGMSGTGKTSLPKIFAEALMGNCEIVEVESSWRDKNELLGYYNEFSKCYTPKKFTQCLYKAKLNPDILTFIVLDEMNLSRIEYYFSDFLSLMENEEDKREIKLLNIKLSRLENGQNINYRALTDGHTLKIPTNVWFIGTANRDESTFAISDKVYDRAQTMNFNKRAPKIHSFGEPLSQRFAPYNEIKRLFDDAKANGVFEAEDNELIQKAESLLAPFNISFGNRILKQMEDFVKIYCACFGSDNAVEKDAVEKILLSKVVSKLENKVVENKESLAAEFDRIGLHACSEFVRKLNED